MHKTLFLVGALVGAGLAILVTQPGVMSVGVSAVAAAPDTYQGLSLFGEVFDRVRADYVDRPDDHKLIESALDGMLRELDPHSGYVDQANLDEMQRQSRGEFVGVGLEIAMEDGLLEVVTPIENSPAAKAGISALPSWDSKTRRNNLCRGLAVRRTAGPSGHTNSPHPSSREGHHSTARWISIFLLSHLISTSPHAVATSRVQRNAVPSTQMRCMITANRRARATIAFFIPRRLAICIAQALSHDHFFEYSML